MLQPGQNLSLVAKATQHERCAETWFDELDRHLFAVLIIIAHRPVDRSHPAFADEASPR